MDAVGWQQQLTRIERAQALPAVLLMGEQHDAAAHQQWEHDTVQALARQRRLAAVVLEMADAGQDTRGLDPYPSES
ncbi:ChaN family lipoprotein, partial [Staphylococcus aureus]|nr:ChaN family lipoprotein [Staphylococcus aureus]